MLARYQKGSMPIIGGQAENNSFCIIREGSVRQSLTGINIHLPDEILKVGDFFGVIACMAQRPHFHSVEMLEDTLVIVVQRDQFDYLIQTNTPVALKIIRYFSQKLRQLDAILTKLSLNSFNAENPSHLFEIGDYYENKRRFPSHAAYAYLRYIKFCPSGVHVSEAKTRFTKLFASNKNTLKLDPEKRDNYFLYYDQNQVVFLEHEPGNQLYIIQEGNIKISKIVNSQEILLNILKPGDIFGEMAILENRPRNANAITSNPTKLMAVTKENFPLIVAKHPQIATKIITLLSDRIWFLHSHISNMLLSDPETRLYDALNIHLQKARVSVAERNEYCFNLTFEDLLRFTGLDNNIGYKALQKILENKKVFSIEDGMINCKDVSQIEKLTNFLQKNRQLQEE